MWICFNDGFVSAVQDRGDARRLVVRARRKEHLEVLFPASEGFKIITAAPFTSDYKYRVFVSKVDFARIVTERIMNISYDNFKNSVKDDRLHDLYGDFWELHNQYQR